jgi:DME family drug/metabolite transporter
MKHTLTGFLCALLAGAIWGTTGPLSTALYAEGQHLAGIGFWRVLLGLAGLGAYGLLQRDFFRVDRKGLLLVAGLGGLLVAAFEIPYQFGIAGAGVAASAALLYLAPVMIALLARPILGEKLTWTRAALALVVVAGAVLTVTGTMHDAFVRPPGAPAVWVGVVGGLIAMASYAGTTLLARWAVPRYGALRVLFFELLGGTVTVALLLAASGGIPLPPASAAGRLYTVAMAAGPVLAANFFFFAAVRRIEAAPTAVAATIEPVVGATLALVLFNQRLAPLGWVGLLLVVAGVALTYRREERATDPFLTSPTPASA